MKLLRDLSAAHVAERLVRRYRYRVIRSRGSRMTVAGRRSASGDHAAASGRGVGTLDGIVADVAAFPVLPKQDVHDILFG